MPPVDSARWATALTASYLAITAGLIAMLGQAVPGRGWLIALHLTLCGALLLLNRARPAAGIGRVIRDWHPLMLFPFLYKEVELLAGVIGDWRLTAVIPGWEAALFAGQPSLYLSERLTLVPLSEYLHFCYLAHVVVIPAVAAYWYVSGRRAAFGELVLLLSTAMLGSYLFFILLPVDSPYYLSQRLGPPLSGHFFFDLVHQMSARGGARGGAFPSAHVSGALVGTLVAWRHQRRLAYALVPLTLGVMVATVYGRFHYALDALAGAALAVAVVVVYRYLAGGRFGEGLPSNGSDHRQRAMERRAAIRVVLGPDLSAVGGDDRAADREAQAEALVTERHERLEHPLELPVGNAGAAIGDREPDEAVAVHRRDEEAAFGRGRAIHRVAGVHQEVQHDLLQLHPIGLH
jgi:membrane-associated phospholipid phosphatase